MEVKTFWVYEAFRPGFKGNMGLLACENKEKGDEFVRKSCSPDAKLSRKFDDNGNPVAITVLMDE